MVSTFIGMDLVSIRVEERSLLLVENLSNRSTQEKVLLLKVHREATKGREVSIDSSLRFETVVQTPGEAFMDPIIDGLPAMEVTSGIRVVSLIMLDHFSFILDEDVVFEEI